DAGTRPRRTTARHTPCSTSRRSRTGACKPEAVRVRAALTANAAQIIFGSSAFLLQRPGPRYHRRVARDAGGVHRLVIFRATGQSWRRSVQVSTGRPRLDIPNPACLIVDVKFSRLSV